MSLRTFTISDKKLGFVLDKTKETPTIGKIIENGALEKQLVESCSNISIGSKIKYINEDSIQDLNFEKANEFIKNYTTRPIRITIESPRNNSEDINEKKFINKITPEQMESISKIQTQKSLKELSNIIKENNHLKRKTFDSDSGSDYDSDYDNEFSRSKIHKYENTIRNLKFEINNLEITIDELKQQMTEKRQPLELINDDMCHIKSINRKLDSIKYGNISSNIEDGLKTIKKDYNDYIKSCNKNSDKIDLHEIRTNIKKYINDENKNFNEKLLKINKIIYFNYILDIIKTISVIIVIVMCVYTLVSNIGIN